MGHLRACGAFHRRAVLLQLPPAACVDYACEVADVSLRVERLPIYPAGAGEQKCDNREGTQALMHCKLKVYYA